VNITDLPLPNVVEALEPYEQTRGTDLRGGVCFNLGGRSVFWSAVIPQMKHWELAHWPTSIADYLVNGGYDEAERLFRKRVNYPPFQLELQAKIQDRFKSYEVSQLPRSYHQPDSVRNPRPGSPDERTTGVFSTAALLSDALMNARRAGSDYLHVGVQHLVDRVVLDQATGDGLSQATAVEALDLRTGLRRRFEGRYIVLAGGATESPRLALTSGVYDPSHKMGRGLADHPEAEVHFEIPQDCAFFDRNSQGNLFLRPINIEDGADGFSCELALNWKFWDVRIEDDYWWRRNFGKKGPIQSTIKFLFRSPLKDENRIYIRGSKYYVHLEPMVTPSERLQAQVEDLSRDLLALFDVKNPPQVEYHPFSVTYHLGGSMRMSEKESDGVVDTNLRLHRYENLYCCDLSVFPDIPASNPSLTLGALARRLADELARKKRESQNVRGAD